MYTSEEMGRACYNSDEDTEDASESEMPKYEYEQSQQAAHHNIHNLNHHHHNHHHPHLHHHHAHQQHHQMNHMHHPYSHMANNHHHPHHHQLNAMHMNSGGGGGSIHYNVNSNHNNNNVNNGNNYTELREQMYLDKLNNLREQLYQLDAGIHPEFLKQLKRVDSQRQDRMLLNEAFQIYETERVEREYMNEKKAALREFEDRKIELRESLILELEDRRRMIENERSSMELLSDCAETKPVTTRKLRRRPNEPAPNMPDKRRRTSPAQLNHQLEEKEIQDDMKALLKATK